MEKITSFCIDHDILTPGMYLNKVQDGIDTFDIRMKKPNGGDYLDQKGLHSFEHIFATYARNTEWADAIVYIGPMGCRTGFYLLTKGMSRGDAIRLVQDSMEFIAGFDGEIPGAQKKECGNYLEHDLQSAKEMAKAMIPVLTDWSEEKLEYPA